MIDLAKMKEMCEVQPDDFVLKASGVLKLIGEIERLTAAHADVEWESEHGGKYSMTADGAARILKEFFDAWPGGLDEIRSCIQHLRGLASDRPSPASAELPAPVGTIFDDGYWNENRTGPFAQLPFHASRRNDVFTADQMREYARVAVTAALDRSSDTGNLIAPNREGCNPAYNDCACPCHRTAGMMHFVPCCGPGINDPLDHPSNSSEPK
jgi:hypothetical protein